jgi:hypothetical protein
LRSSWTSQTLGVLGMGRIGYALAKRGGGGWDMRVLYHDVHRNEPAEKELGAKLVDLDTLLRESDFVSVHTALNEETCGLFNAERFKKMKRTAVCVNTARGPIIPTIMADRTFQDAATGRLLTSAERLQAGAAQTCKTGRLGPNAWYLLQEIQ